MMKLMRGWLCLVLAASILFPSGVYAQIELASADLSEADIFQVVSASHLPQPQNQAPATVYVVTSDDIKYSGAQNIWDALRAVPGLDVASTRASFGYVNVRGLNKSNNNRLLVLLDGKTMQTSTYDTISWGTIPVSLDEIDRIEVVEGSASALYGPNAVSGVVNIITKTPGQIDGGLVKYTGGERRTHIGNFLYGKEEGKLAYKVGYGFHSAYSFDDADVRSMDSSKFHAMTQYAFTKDSELSIGGGLSNFNTQYPGGGGVGLYYHDGVDGFLQSDYRFKNTKLSGFWSHRGSDLRGTGANVDVAIPSNLYEVNLEQFVRLPFNNSLTLGGSGRQVTSTSDLVSNHYSSQNLGALYFENQWKPTNPWSVVATGRYDHHPLAGGMFSPRGSIIYQPVNAHTLRLTAGTSFRYPTLLENRVNYILVRPNPGTPFPNPPFTNIETTVAGRKDMKPEKMANIEIAHRGDFGKVRTTLTLFHYELRNAIDATPLQLATPAPIPPTVSLMSSFINRDSTIFSWGGEGGVDVSLSQSLTSFVNYSYQSVRSKDLLTPNISPKHKVNAGFRFKKGGVTANLWGHWVDKALMNANSPYIGLPDYKVVSDYVLLNAQLSYAFQTRLKGLEVAVSVFNLNNDRHYESLPAQSVSQSAEDAELIKQRWAGTVSYRF